MPKGNLPGFDFVMDVGADGPQPLGTTVYHSYNETVGELVQISIDHPDITKLVSIGRSLEGRDIWAMKVSDNPDIEEDEPEIFYFGNHHAREWLTIEVCLYILNYLTDNYLTNSTITGIVNSRQVWVVPIVNPDGRVYDSPYDDPADHSNQPYGWRKNRRDNGDGSYGVDLNRNYGYMWGGAGASSDPSDPTYRGPKAFSENESQVIRDFARQHNFVFAISYHSYSQLILYPWGYTYNESKDDDILSAVANDMADLITNKANSSYPGYTPAQGSDLYMTSGTTTDWLYGEFGTYSFCVELYPDRRDFLIQNDPAVSPPYDLFHPSQDKVVPVCEDNIEAALYLAQIADNPFQAMDYHVSLSTQEDSQVINQSETGQFTISVLNDGANDEFFNLSASTIPGWTIDLSTETMFLWSETSGPLTLTVTVPGAQSGGEYYILVNATSQSDSSVTDSLVITVHVPFFNDVGMQSIDTFINQGSYPIGEYSITSTARNFGRNGQSNFDTSLKIVKLGNPVIETVFSDDMEAGSTGWEIVDLDGSESPDTWKVVSSTYNSPTNSFWCGSSTKYSNKTAQLLISPTFSLKWAVGANLSFYHKYQIERAYDYGSVDIFNGIKWITLTSFDGDGPSSFEQENISLIDFIGYEDLRIRFRFTSDEGVIDDGWYIDDVAVSAEFPQETVVYGPIVQQTNGLMSQDDTQQLIWDYTFTELGDFKIYSTTLLDSDENQDNNLSCLIITIIPAPPSYEIPLEFGWNLVSLPLIRSDTSVASLLEPISDKYDAIQWYNSSDFEDPWKHHHVQKPSHLNDLEEINHRMGFLIHIIEPAGVVLNFTGQEIISNQTIALNIGWNLVGYPSASNKIRDEALNNLTYGDDVDAIWTFDYTTQKWQEIGEFDSFEKGRGYLINSNTKIIWDVPL
jgi:murein tripeptide amidase MpaA